MLYHWFLKLLRRLKLPLFDGMAEALQKGDEVVQATLKKKRTEETKENRTSWKKARVQEQEERKQWIRKQRIQHTFGSDNEKDGDDDLSDNNEHHTTCTSSRTQEKCTTTHRITTNCICP